MSARKKPHARWDGISEPPAVVAVTKDCDGDHWYRFAGELWGVTPTDPMPVPWGTCGGRRCSEPHPEDLGPHTVVSLTTGDPA